MFLVTAPVEVRRFQRLGSYLKKMLQRIKSILEVT